MSLPNKRILLRRSKFGEVWEHGLADGKATLLAMIPAFVPPEPPKDPPTA